MDDYLTVEYKENGKWVESWQSPTTWENLRELLLGPRNQHKLNILTVYRAYVKESEHMLCLKSYIDTELKVKWLVCDTSFSDDCTKPLIDTRTLYHLAPDTYPWFLRPPTPEYKDITFKEGLNLALEGKEVFYRYGKDGEQNPAFKFAWDSTNGFILRRGAKHSDGRELQISANLVEFARDDSGYVLSVKVSN